MGSGYNLDPAKIGQEGYNLLKYYEQQLKALQVRAWTFWDLDETIMIYSRSGRRIKHKPNEAVQRIEGGVEREDQGGQEGGQGEVEGDVRKGGHGDVDDVGKDLHDDHCCVCRFRSHLPRQNDPLVCWPHLVLTFRCFSLPIIIIQSVVHL